MTSTKCESRQALRRLASQACSATPNNTKAEGTGEKNGIKVAGLILAGMAGTVGWMMYSHGMQSSRTAADSPVTAGAIEPNSAPSGIGSTAWTSDAIAVNPPSHQAAPGPKAVAAKAANAAHDDNLEKRVEPVEALARHGDPGAVPAVLDALHDDDWRVRSRVIDAAVNAYVPIPESALIEHAQSDPSAEVRFGALAGIAARIDPAIPQVDAVDPGTARAISRQALSDASEPVRWQAQQILDALDAKTSAPSNDQSQTEML